MKSCVYAGLGLTDDELFKNLLARNEQQASQELTAFLGQASEQYPPAVIFYCINHEVEEMVEVVEGIKQIV